MGGGCGEGVGVSMGVSISMSVSIDIGGCNGMSNSMYFVLSVVVVRE